MYFVWGRAPVKLLYLPLGLCGAETENRLLIKKGVIPDYEKNTHISVGNCFGIHGALLAFGLPRNRRRHLGSNARNG